MNTKLLRKRIVDNFCEDSSELSVLVSVDQILKFTIKERRKERVSIKNHIEKIKAQVVSEDSRKIINSVLVLIEDEFPTK
jgi:hypothetical protein